MSKSKKNQEPFKLHHMLPEQDGQTLSAVVRSLFPESSWGDAKQKITSRQVQVNGNLCLDHARRLTPKDVIKVWKLPLPKPVQTENLRFTYVDPHLVVVEKPAGITSVRHFEERNMSKQRKKLQPTLEELLPEALVQYFDKKEGEGQAKPKRARPHFDPIRARHAKPELLPRIIAVHRLDRDTSGLMIFARTQPAAELLGRMFRKHTIDRRYWAVIHGQIADQTIESFLIRDIGGGRRGSTQNVEDPEAQKAITHVRSLERLKDYSIIECRLETGRTHQIRIHLAELGHRLCGESIYNRDSSGKPCEDASGAPRQALHSASLSFIHPITGESLQFKMPWPNDLHKWIRTLKK